MHKTKTCSLRDEEAGSQYRSHVEKFVCALYLRPLLYLQEGDLILLDKQINKDWFHGTCDSRKGVFPANFVEVIVELSSGDNVCEKLFLNTFSAVNHGQPHKRVTFFQHSAYF